MCGFEALIKSSMSLEAPVCPSCAITVNGPNWLVFKAFLTHSVPTTFSASVTSGSPGSGAARLAAKGSSLMKDSLRKDTWATWMSDRAHQQLGFDCLKVTLPLVTQTTAILGQLIILKELERGLS